MILLGLIILLSLQIKNLGQCSIIDCKQKKEKVILDFVKHQTTLEIFFFD